LLEALIEPLKILAELPKQPAANSQKFVAKKQTGTEPGGREPSFGKM